MNDEWEAPTRGARHTPTPRVADRFVSLRSTSGGVMNVEIDEIIRAAHARSVKSIALSASGAWTMVMASASADGEIHVRSRRLKMDVYAGNLATETSSSSLVNAHSHSHGTLTSTSTSFALIARLRGHDGAVKGARVSGGDSGDLTRVASASYDRTARLWTLNDTPPMVFRGHRDYVLDCALVTDDAFGDVVATTSADGMIRAYSAHDGSTVAEVDVSEDGVGAATTIDVWIEANDDERANDGVIASARADGSIRFHHARSGRCAMVLLGHLGAVTGVATPDRECVGEGHRREAPTHTRVCYGCKNGTVGAFALRSKSDGQSVEVEDAMRTSAARPEAELEGVTCVKFMRSSTARTIASSSEDGTVRIWDVQRGTCTHILTGQVSASIECVAMLSDVLACGGSDGSVFVWKINAEVSSNARDDDASTLATRADIALRWLLRKGPQVCVDERGDEDEDELIAAAYESADHEARSLLIVDPKSLGTGAICTICHESRVDGSVDAATVQLPCSHAFHASCLLSWMAVSNNCPNCRDINYDSGLPHVLTCIAVDDGFHSVVPSTK